MHPSLLVRYRPSAVRWCLTVPAGLSQRSMTIMREAAMDAGIIPSLESPALQLATEPEAAALTAQQRKDLLGLSSGEQDTVRIQGFLMSTCVW